MVVKFDIPAHQDWRHSDGSVTKGGVRKCEQKQINADKRRQMQAIAEVKTQAKPRKHKQTRAEADKCKQTLTPPFLRFLAPPFAIPLQNRKSRNRSDFPSNRREIPHSAEIMRFSLGIRRFKSKSLAMEIRTSESQCFFL